MKGFFWGVVVTLLAIGGVTYGYFAAGFAPVATDAQPMPFEKRLARLALHARIEREMPKSSPIDADETAFQAGARLYVDHCAVCHGLPGKAETAIARGEFPKPPQLFRGHGVTDDPPGETFWKTANGIRLTGMPGFRSSLSDNEIWQVTLLLSNANRLPASVTAVLAGEPAAEAAPTPAPSPTP